MISASFLFGGSMPFPNEHAARLVNPGEFVRFRRVNNELGSGIHAIYGIREDGTSAIQSVRFDVSDYTRMQARKWLRDHEMSTGGFEPAAEKETRTKKGYLELKVPEEHAEELAINPDDPTTTNPEDMHITLGVFDATYLDPTVLVKAVADIANEAHPVSVRLNGKARFMNSDEHAAVVLTDSPELFALRNKAEAQVSPFDTMHGYNPHITIKKLTPDEADPEYMLPPGIITLTEMVLTVDGREYMFPMRGMDGNIPPGFHMSKGENMCKACASHREEGKGAGAMGYEPHCARFDYGLTEEGWVCDDYMTPSPDEIEFFVAALPPDLPIVANGEWDEQKALVRVQDREVDLPEGAWVVSSEEKNFGLICDVDDEQGLVIVPAAVKALFDNEWPKWIEGSVLKDAQKYSAQCAHKVMAQEDTQSKSVDLDTFEAMGHQIEFATNGNQLKALNNESTEDNLVVANYLVLWGGRDLEGTLTRRVNADGSKGEFFTPATDFESIFTEKGFLPEDWEHRQDVEGIAPKDQVLGHVDWKSAQMDSLGLWAKRVLDRRNMYIKMLEQLGWFQKGLIGSSTEPISADVVKGDDGELIKWPLRADTMTVMPMEPRMMAGNELEIIKALGVPLIEGDKNKIEAAKIRLRIKLSS
jgi:2'-5' RNA ligase